MNTLDAQFITILIGMIGSALLIYKKVHDIDKTEYDDEEHNKRSK